MCQRLLWKYTVMSLDTTQTPLFITTPHPPPLPLIHHNYRRSRTTGTARSVTGIGGRASGASRWGACGGSLPLLLIFPQMRAFDSTSLISRLRTNKYIILNVSKQITLYRYRRYFVHCGYQNDTRGIALARDTLIWRSSIVQQPFWFFCTKLRLLHVCFVQQPLSYHKISTS